MGALYTKGVNSRDFDPTPPIRSHSQQPGAGIRPQWEPNSVYEDLALVLNALGIGVLFLAVVLLYRLRTANRMLEFARALAK